MALDNLLRTFSTVLSAATVSKWQSSVAGRRAAKVESRAPTVVRTMAGLGMERMVMVVPWWWVDLLR